jgi:hypothetical protein
LSLVTLPSAYAPMTPVMTVAWKRRSRRTMCVITAAQIPYLAMRSGRLGRAGPGSAGPPGTTPARPGAVFAVMMPLLRSRSLLTVARKARPGALPIVVRYSRSGQAQKSLISVGSPGRRAGWQRRAAPRRGTQLSGHRVWLPGEADHVTSPPGGLDAMRGARRRSARKPALQHPAVCRESWIDRHALTAWPGVCPGGPQGRARR